MGVREYSISQTRDQPVDFLTGEGSGFTDVMIGVNPGDPDTDFLRAMRALSEADEEGFSELLEKALSTRLHRPNRSDQRGCRFAERPGILASAL